MHYNERMPVLLHADEWEEHWLTCSIKDVIAIQYRTYPADNLNITPKDETWIPRNTAPMRTPDPQFL